MIEANKDGGRRAFLRCDPSGYAVGDEVLFHGPRRWYSMAWVRLRRLSQPAYQRVTVEKIKPSGIWLWDHWTGSPTYAGW